MGILAYWCRVQEPLCPALSRRPVCPSVLGMLCCQDEDLAREGEDLSSGGTAAAKVPWKAMELIQNARVRSPGPEP